MSFTTAHQKVAEAAKAAGGAVSDWRDQVQRLAQFADTATRMSAKDMRNNMETLADELTKLLATAPAATADSDSPMQILADINDHMRGEWAAGRLPAACWPIRFVSRIDAALAAQQKDTP